MNTFGKILLFALLALVVMHLFPVLMVPVILMVAGMLLVGTILVGGIAALLGTVLVLIAVLTPIWLPVLALYGIVALCRRNNRKETA